MQGCRTQAGFTLVELLVVMAVIAILSAVLLPVLSTARENARKSKCQSHLRQLGAALNLYAQDNDGVFPAADPNQTGAGRTPLGIFWANCLYPYVRNYQVFACPDQKTNSMFLWGRWRFSINPIYGWNEYLNYLDDSAVTDPSATVAIADCSHAVWAGRVGRIAWANSKDQIYYPVLPATSATFMTDQYSRHNGGENMVFVDGHVKWQRSAATYAAGEANLTYATR